MDEKIHFEGYLRCYLNKYMERKKNGEVLSTEFYDYLLNQIYNISSRTILILLHAFKKKDMLTGNSPEERYSYFDNCTTTDEFHDMVDRMYPLLRMRLDKILDNHIINYNNLKERLKNDCSEIFYEFGLRTENIDDCHVSYGISDAHRGAKAVCIIEKNNKRIVYKPRSGRTDICWGDFINWFNSKNPSLKLKTNKVLDKGEYHWQEYIDNEACEYEDGIKKLYYRMGMLSVIAYAFKVEDLHMENIIVNRDFPYIVDLETIFQTDGFQNVNSGTKIATDILNKMIRQSVLSTQLFPVPGKFYDSNVDISGIAGKGGQSIKNGKLATINKFTDEVYVVRSDGMTENRYNIGLIIDVAVDPKDYTKEITDGFNEGYILLQNNKDELLKLINSGELFRDIQPRYIFRNTNLYGVILEKSKNPEYLKNKSELNRLYSLLYSNRVSDNHAYVYRSEVEDLLNEDIPYFYGKISEKYIYNSQGEICYTLKRTPLSEINMRIRHLNLEDLNIQTDLIIKSMKKHKKTWNMVRNNMECIVQRDNNENKQILIDVAKNIGNTLINNAIIHKNTATINWLDIRNDFPTWNISAQDVFMYNGLAGNAIFFSSLYMATKEERYKEALNKVLNTINNDRKRINSKNVSPFNGIVSLAYLYAFLYNHTNDERMLNHSIDLIKSYRNEIIQNVSYDIIDGLSGMLTVILNIYRLSGDKELGDLSIEIGKDILSNIQIKNDAAYWKKGGKNELIMAGFSHGLAGVTYALCKLNRITEYKDNIPFIHALIESENRCYSDKIENWIDLRSEDTLSTDNSPIHWCHGAAGIGLSRLKNKDIIDTSDDIDRAVKAVVKNGLNRDSDCLCHGNLGNIELLLELYKQSGDRNMYNTAVSRAVEIISENSQGRSYRNGIGQEFDSPGFMLGLSGMGYQLLRIAYPDKNPSVLLLEV